MRYRTILLVAALFVAGCAETSRSTADSGGPEAEPGRRPRRPEIVIPYVDPAPCIDGELADEAWSGLAWIPMSHPFGHRLKKSDDNFGVKIGWNYRGVFVAFRCDDADIRAKELPRDGALWSGDSLEVFFDPQDRGATHYEIAVNPEGSFYDYLIMPRKENWGPARETRWDMEDFEHAVMADEDGWRAEMFIPFRELETALCFPPGEGQAWRGHIGAMDRDKESFTAANIFPIAGAHEPSSYGAFRFSHEKWREIQKGDRAAAVNLGVRDKPQPADLSGMSVYSDKRGKFAKRDGGWFSKRGYGIVQRLDAFIEERRSRGKPEYREIILPGVWTPSEVYVVHPADFEDPLTLVRTYSDPINVAFRAAGELLVFYRKSPVTLPEGSSEYTTKGDGIGLSVAVDGEVLACRWTRSAAWRVLRVGLGDEEKEVILRIDSGPATNHHDYTEVAVYRD